MTSEEKIAATRQTQTIPIDRLLAEYGKTHLQLTVAEETIGRQQGQIAALSKQLQDSLKRGVEHNDKLSRLESKFARLASLTPDNPSWPVILKEMGEGLNEPDANETRTNVKVPTPISGLTSMAQIELKDPRNAQESKPEEARTAQDG